MQASLEEFAARRRQLEQEAMAAVLRTAERTPDPDVQPVLSGFSAPGDNGALGPPPPCVGPRSRKPFFVSNAVDRMTFLFWSLAAARTLCVLRASSEL